MTDLARSFVAEQEQLRREAAHNSAVAARLIAALMGKQKKKIISAEKWAATAGVRTASENTPDGGVVISVTPVENK